MADNRSSEVILKRKKPVLSVGLPMYRSKYIGWLAFEGLCRQTGVSFPWELVISEEVEPLPLGRSAVLSYADRLREVGCVRIVYETLLKWIPLGDKWLRLVALSHPSSQYFALQATDRLPPPGRLKNTFLLATKKYACYVQTYKRLLYHILRENVVILDQMSLLQEGIPSGMDATIHMNLIRLVTPVGRERGVDKWLRESCQAKCAGPFHVVADTRSDWSRGVDTLGLNNISKYRDSMASDPLQMMTVNA